MVAVSPIVGGEVLKGPTAQFMAFAALDLSAAGVADFYGELLDGMVADESAGSLATLQTDTRMDDAAARARLAEEDPLLRPSPGGLAVRTAAVLPVKSFARAKQRLGASVDDPLRLELAGAMVADVLLALAQTSAIDLTIVVTRERAVADAARAAARWWSRIAPRRASRGGHVGGRHAPPPRACSACCAFRETAPRSIQPSWRRSWRRAPRRMRARRW